MKERWARLAARFEALAQRERALVFIAAIAATILLFQAFAIDPLLSQRARLAQQLAETRQNIKIAEAVLNVRQAQADPDAIRRTYRDALRKQLAEVDANMQSLGQRLVPPERMAKLLEQMLARSRGLRLVSLRTLPARRFDNPGAAPAAPQAEKGAKPAPKDPERGIFQHSVELTVEGSYADLHEYLARLERAPQHVFWGRLTLDTGQYPRLTATLTVHTLSLSKAWLVV